MYYSILFQGQIVSYTLFFHKNYNFSEPQIILISSEILEYFQPTPGSCAVSPYIGK